MEKFDIIKIKPLPLSSRESKSSVEKIIIDPSSKDSKSYFKENPIIKKLAEDIILARKNNKPVILVFGAHVIKNGLSKVLIELIEKDLVTHLATNGAGSIHDWEIAYQGKTEEDVRKYIREGQFGIWDETGKYINLALITGAFENKGYGYSIAEMISKDNLKIPEKINNDKLNKYKINGTLDVKHKYKQYSIQNAAYKKGIPFTVHPGFGYDIIYTNPLCDGSSIGKCAENDFLSFVNSIYNLDGGVYISVGSAIMSPMIFEKSLSMARNVRKQEGKNINDFVLVINDIQEGCWEWGKNIEPPKSDPSYYLRFCKSFDRMGAKEMHYVQEDNRNFLVTLYQYLVNK